MSYILPIKKSAFSIFLGSWHTLSPSATLVPPFLPYSFRSLPLVLFTSPLLTSRPP